MSDNYGAYCKSCKVRQPSCCGLCTVCVSELEAKNVKLQAKLLEAELRGNPAEAAKLQAELDEIKSEENDMSDNPVGKNGIARMWARFKQENKVAWGAWRDQSDSHDIYINFFVEYCRHAPYLVGHLLAWFTPVIILALIFK